MEEKDKEQLLDKKLGNYEENIEDISKLLEWLPDDEARRAFINAVAFRLIIV